MVQSRDNRDPIGGVRNPLRDDVVSMLLFAALVSFIIGTIVAMLAPR